jgi:two-component system sensor histidine kinase KdpD
MRGCLRVYLGMAPGVGKTFAMLDEGRRRLDRGTDVVVAVVETHGRAHTAEQLAGLEIVPRRTMSYRGAAFEELDLDAVLARRPAVALVDELAHTNIPGSRNEKRWQDVDELLDAGIDVITTVNIQHLESLNDVVQKISGVEQRETIPDEIVRRADQIEIVDISPEALRRRMAHGNIYPPDRVDAALSNYFRVGNLSALRELALLWVAERVDEALQRYRAAHGIEQSWEARERIVVSLPGGPEGETLLRRAVRIAARTTGSELLAVHVVKGDGLSPLDPAEISRQRRLAESMGGSWHQLVGDDVAVSLLDFARAENATQIVLGTSRHGRWEAFLAGEGVGARVTRMSGSIDVHLVTHEAASAPGLRVSVPVAGLTTALSVRRRVQGAVLALVALPLLTLLLDQLRGELNLPSDILLFLAVVIVVALVGGLWPALAAAVAGSLLLNYYFTPPLYTFTISDKNNALALLVFIAVAALVSALVERVVRRTTEAGRAQAEAAILAGLAGGILRGETSLEQILARARETFGLTSVALLERAQDDGDWTTLACVGSGDARAFTDIPVSAHLRLRVDGVVRGSDQRLLTAFAAQAAVVRERAELSDRAAEAAVVAEADRTRAALLTAVSHDLRSPLASAKASVTSLRSDRVEWSDEAREELLETADESLDRLTRLIENLLDLSRLEAGALAVSLAPVALDELVPVVLDALGRDDRVRVDVPDSLPEAYADAVLLERVLANLLGNALRYSPPDEPPLLAASCHAGSVEIRVVDRGPGVPRDQRERMFAPFQRLGDRDSSTGVGLGLALSQGLTLAMGGSLAADDTPGGGLTMTVTLPLVGPPVGPSVGPSVGPLVGEGT